MNEVKTVHLGREQFTIAVDAHKALRDYLAAIEKQPGVQSEVVKEVEMRMAELLHEHGVTGDKVVLPEDVDFLKQQLGEPRDFKDEAEQSEETVQEEQPKRLYRDTQNAVWAGVASGLAAYLGINAWLIRIAFVALTFASGAGVLLYALIWLLAPEAKTPSERLQMQGKAVTVDSLKGVVDRADLKGASERAGRTFAEALGTVLRVAFRAVGIIIGVSLTIAGSVVLLSTIAMGAYMLIHGGQIGNDIIFPSGAHEVWFVILASLTVAIIGFFILLAGLTVISLKWRIPAWLVAALLGVFLVSGSIGTALGFDVMPTLRERIRTAHHQQTRDLQPFSAVSFNGQDTRFVFKPDDRYFVELSYLGNVDTKPLKTEVVDGRLMVDGSTFSKTPLCKGICFYSDHDLVITVHAPRVDSVRLSGPSNSFFIRDRLQQDNLTIESRRYALSSIHLSYMHAQSVKLIDNRDAAERTIAINGIAPQSTGDDGIRMDEGATSVDHADSFELQTSATCDPGDPLVYLGAIPGNVMVNGQQVKDGQSLVGRDGPSAIDCVTLR